MSAPVSREFRSRRLRLHYLEWGNDDAPTIILVHGGNDHARSWDFVADRLRGDYRIFAPDLRGHGDSDWSPDGHYSLTANAIDLAELIRHERLAPATIVAHSYGAMTALHHAALFPEQVARLVAIEGIVTRSQTDETVRDRIRTHYDRQRAFIDKTAPRYATIEDAAARMKVTNPRLSAEMAHHLALHGTRPGADGGHSWKFDPLVRLRTPIDLSPEEEFGLYAQIACPVLMLQGDESTFRIGPDDPRAGAIPDGRLVTLEGAGHWVQHDRLDGVVEAIRGFLSPA
ncbi:alpha/beta fold hydrolase [Sphingomonas oryzagri]|uniref:Alpha/beta hydrolase n=1 Tax=Sphingomonas oryzagri TaxID=3042314 RepID=A0ABT6N0A8_9SPHN|nr:alpha/beta hydrolase [Sphingomonas oryzagri]MDH7638677.1 alpha/beta hydrolase [Sphingomonas oryzagri]